jgi:(p)ppGpp synthase/HD superfamily hydrolase
MKVKTERSKRPESGRTLLKRPPGKILFFAPLEVSLTPSAFESVVTAYEFSKHGHALQLPRDDGSRSFDHPKAATWIYVHELGGRDPRVIIVTLLHDMSEDSRMLSPYRISLNFGEDIALDVRAVTKLPEGDETLRQCLFRIIARGPWSILAKLLDCLHNVRTLCGCTREKQVRKAKDYRMYLRLLVPALRAYGGEWATYADHIQSKMREALARY